MAYAQEKLVTEEIKDQVVAPENKKAKKAKSSGL